jgi:molybdopterin converting factor small subunit
VELLAGIFAKAIEQDQKGIVQYATDAAHQVLMGLAGEREKLVRRRERLTSQRKRVRRKDEGVNLLHGVIDQQLAQLQTKLRDLDQHLKVASAACKLIASYQEDNPGWSRGIVFMQGM